MPTLIENLPAELRQLDRWVGVDADVAQQLGFSPKTPLKLYETSPASTTEPKTWSSYNTALRCIRKGIYDDVGFVFNNDGLVGIDIDCGFDENGFPTKDALDIIKACKSYTETSKSGRGFHIICKGNLPFRGRANGKGWEVYRDGRYFILTGKTVLYKDIVEAQDGINLLLERHFVEETSEPVDNNQSRDKCIWEPKLEHFENGKFPLREIYPVISEGNRHLSMVSFCGQKHTYGAHASVVLELALQANQLYLQPPLPVEEIERIVKSVCRYRR